MQLFEPHIQQVREFQERQKANGAWKEYLHTGRVDWPASNYKNLVLAGDTAVELGHPEDVSTAFLLWTNNTANVTDRRISVIGPDLKDLHNQKSAFGRIVLAAAEDFNEDNSFDRYREMELLRYDIDLKGYMMRGVSQHQREWSRVSRQALNNGFSFDILGGALIDKFNNLPYISATEVIFVTQGREAVLELKSIADRAIQIIGAMNKMAEELSLDCSTCEYNAVCSEVAGLRSMRSTLKQRKAVAHA